MFQPLLFLINIFFVTHSHFLTCAADIISCMLNEPTVPLTCGTDEYLKKLSKIDEGPKAQKQKKNTKKGRGQLLRKTRE